MAACRASCDLIVYLLIFISVVYFCELRCPHQPYSKGRTQANKLTISHIDETFRPIHPYFIRQYVSILALLPPPSSLKHCP